MKALIIAAGKGRRMCKKTQKIPKPLLKLDSKTIIETIIDTAKNAGIYDFLIVVGYKGEKIKASLNSKNLKVQFISNPFFKEKDNGLSVLQAKEALKTESSFLLMMADHIFEEKLLRKLLKTQISKGCVLAIDKNLKATHDLKEATKVYEKDGKILDIGKDIARFNGIDTGFFICTQDIFKALEKAILENHDKLSDAMKILSKQKKLDSVDVTGFFWFDIDTENDLSFAKENFMEKLK